MVEDIPAHSIETINELVRISRRLLLDLGREPTPEEIADKLAIPGRKVAKAAGDCQSPDRPYGKLIASA